CGLQCGIAEDLSLERWRKLVWNIPFNGLSILAGGLDTAAILADEALHRVTLGLMNEVIDAANKCGHALESAAALEQIKRTENMSAYKPSTLLTGGRASHSRSKRFGVRPAADAGANTPKLEMVYALLKTLDAKRAQPE